MKIAGLSIYPVKSLGGVHVETANVESRGFANDRRWMLVDHEGNLVTRRDVPSIAQILLRHEPGGGFRLSHREGEAVLEPEPAVRDLSPVSIWRDIVDAVVIENDASRLVSKIAGRPLKFAYMLPDVSERPMKPQFAIADETVSFADCFPVLVTSEASLAALNDRLENKVPMERFRANIILSDVGMPWEETQWQEIVTESVTLRLARSCPRCIVITQDHLTGERNEGNIVPSTLRRMGQFNKEGALFGVYAVAEKLGTLAIGDKVTVAR